MFFYFWQKFEIQNGRHFWEEENFLKIARTFLRYPVGKFRRNALSRTVKEIEANLCFAQKFENSKWSGGENFLKIAKSTILTYPVG